MANITMQQFIDRFNAGFETDEDALNAVEGLPIYWNAMMAGGLAKATRAKALAANQQAEAIAQAANAKEQEALAAFVAFVASLQQG